MVSDLRAMWTAAHWSGSSQLAPEKERVAEANNDMEWLVSLQKLYVLYIEHHLTRL